MTSKDNEDEHQRHAGLHRANAIGGACYPRIVGSFDGIVLGNACGDLRHGIESRGNITWKHSSQVKRLNPLRARNPQPCGYYQGANGSLDMRCGISFPGEECAQR